MNHPQSDTALTRERFLALPESVRHASRSLADADERIKEIESSKPINPYSLLRQIGQIGTLTDYKRQLVRAGATQPAADHINVFRNSKRLDQAQATL